MPAPTKLATCSYCSARTMLVPSARDGHELACGSCGAPLHEMKWLKAPGASEARGRRRDTGYIPGVHGPERGAAPFSARNHDPRTVPPGFEKRRKKRKKPLWKRALSEAVDVIEDIFD